MNGCLKVLRSLPAAAAKRALEKQRTYFKGSEWTGPDGSG